MTTIPGVSDTSESEASETSNFSEKKHSCPNCGKSFFHKRKCWRHMRSHLEYHPYECNVCLECFSQKKLLQAHKETHTNSKSYSCSFCPKTFSYLSALNRHCVVHMEEAPYKCPICKATFRSVATRSMHVKNHVVTCVLCQIDFQNYTQLLRHVESVHRVKGAGDEPIKPMSATDVEMMDASSKSIEKDEVKMKFTCFVCEQRFPSKELMMPHLKAHRLFLCSHCPKFFPHMAALNDHEYEHTGQHPFKCDPCGSIFPSAKRLSCHQTECQTISLQSQNSIDIHAIMNTISNAVEISTDMRTQVENALKAALSPSANSSESRQIDVQCTNTKESLQREIEHNIVAFKSAEDLAAWRDTLNESILSTHDLDGNLMPSLDFNNLLHFYWLVHFMKELKSVSYPLSQDLLKKVTHLNTEVTLELAKSTGAVRQKVNFLYLMYVQNELALVQKCNIQTLYDHL